MKSRRLVLLCAGALALAGYAIWTDSAGELLQLAAGNDAVALAPQSTQLVSEVRPATVPAPINPLSGSDLESFAEIVARPLFNPTRAPPAPPIEEAPVVEVAQAPSEPGARAEDFTLLAVSIAENSKVALLRWNKTNEIFHLKQGQFISEWELTSIGEREVTIGRDDVSFALKLFEQARPVADNQQMDAEAQETMNEPVEQAATPEGDGEDVPELNSN